MKLDFNLNEEFFPQNIRIVPENENPDLLHNIFIRFPEIRNPTITFTEAAKAGVYNQLSDEEYNAILNAIKSLNHLWFDKDKNKSMSSASIFELLIRLLDSYITRVQSDYIRDKLYSDSPLYGD